MGSLLVFLLEVSFKLFKDILKIRNTKSPPNGGLSIFDDLID